MGFVETKSTGGTRANQLHIEKIAGCKACVDEPVVDDVLVVYCATHPAYSFTTVVGWYRHATVFREYQQAAFGDYIQSYAVPHMDLDAPTCGLLLEAMRIRSRCPNFWSKWRKTSWNIGARTG